MFDNPYFNTTTENVFAFIKYSSSGFALQPDGIIKNNKLTKLLQYLTSPAENVA